MKTSFNKYLLPGLLALSAGVSSLAAQSNGVPGPQDYSAFSRFIADRNIFDPNREPHTPGRPSTYHRHTTPRGTPGIQFVGTMSYNKGLFAFFSGNTEDLSQVAQVGDKVGGYTVKEITANSVALESADKKDTPTLKVGDGLREEGGKWVVSDAADLPAAGSASSSDSNSTSSTPATAPSAGEPNDILKRLMQQREKENQ